MTPGRVSLKVVGDLFLVIKECLEALRALPSGSLEEFALDLRNAGAAESFLRRAIQAIFDILRHLLAKGYGQGTLEYKQLARLAVEKQIVCDPRLGDILHKLAGFRNRLTHFYQEVTAEELFGIIQNQLGDLEQVADELRQAAARMSQA